jgi:hypothetical protein
MKTLRTLIALAFATALAGSVAFAESDGKKTKVNAEKAPCGCVVGKDKKVCGVDRDCCCTGEKAKGREKTEKTDKAAAKEACCTYKACVPAKGEKKDEKASAKGCTACTVCK